MIERYTEGKRRQAGGDIPALQVHNLDFYYGTNQVLFDMNLEVEQGEMVALLGTNGAGKSTLLRAVSGLSHPAPRRRPHLRHELAPIWSPSRSSTRAWRSSWAGR